MPQLIAVSWDHHELVCIVATPTRRTPKKSSSVDDDARPTSARTHDSGLRVDAAYHLSLNDESDRSIADVAQELADLLRSGRRRSQDQLLVAIPRSEVEMSEFILPDSDPNELPNIVHNALTSQHAELNETSLVDYHVLPDSSEPVAGDNEGSKANNVVVAGTIRVEAAYVNPDTQRVIETLAEALNRQPVRIVVRYHAIVSLFLRQIERLPKTSLLLSMTGTSADISVLHGDRIAFTRSAHLSQTNGQLDTPSLTDEIRRTMFVAPHDEFDRVREVEHVYVFADLDRDDLLVAQLSEELGLPVSLLDPLSGVEVVGQRPPRIERFAAPIGAARDHLQGDPPIDFANPKRPAAPKKLGRRIAAYLVALVACLCLVGYVFRGEVSEARQKVADLNVDVQNNQELLKKLQAKTVVIDAVQRWQADHVNWLNELNRLSQKIPPSHDAVIQRLSMAPAAGGRGMISMSVRVRDQSLIEEFDNALRDDRHDVGSQRISAAVAGSEDLGVQFETRMFVTPPPSTEQR